FFLLGGGGRGRGGGGGGLLGGGGPPPPPPPSPNRPSAIRKADGPARRGRALQSQKTPPSQGGTPPE
ncbi:hypothetical protein ACEN88_12650, partial [Massilia sp. CT11-108]